MNMDASNQTIDVVVVGAGLVGAMVAFHLAEDGRRVAVLDAQRVGQGATSRAIGLATPQLATPALPDTVRGVDALTMLAMQLNLSPRSCSVLHLSSGLAGTDALREWARSFSGDRPHLSWETRPDKLPDGFAGGLVAGYSVQFEIATLTKRLLEHPKIVVRENAEVQALEYRGARILALAQGYTVQCAALVLATNAYAGLLSPMLADAVQMARGYTWLSRPLDDEPSLAEQVQKAVPMPLMIDDGRLLAAQELDGRLRVSAWRPVSDADADPAQDVQHFLHEHLPDALSHTEGRRSGMTVTMPNGMPLIGRLAGDGAVYYALGAGHYGPAWAPVMAERILTMLNEV
jgi:glycine/D-amino acid oxidase-like deaminating enzyme